MLSDKLALRIFSIFGSFILLIIVGRLLYLQVYKHSFYEELVNNQSDPRLTVQTDRGYIYDIEGNILAKNRRVASLYAFRKNIPNVEKFIANLERSGVTLSKKAKESIRSKDSFTWLARRMEIEKAKQLASRIEGLEYFPEDARFYPQGKLMSNILGFTGTDNIGRGGLEYYLDKELTGKKVSVASIMDSRKRIILLEDKKSLKDVESKVYMTISSRLQAGVEHILREGAKRYGAKNGSVIAMDVKTGDIIVSASVNSFNPHAYWKYPKNYWRNHGFNYVFEPGSIFKTVSYSFLHDTNQLPFDKKIDTSKKYTIGEYSYTDTKNYGLLDVEGIYIHSSNIGVAKLMNGIDKNEYYAFLKNAGFGEKTKIFGTNEESGLVYPTSSWSRTSLPSMAIGYEVLVTPLQMLRFYAAIANGGIMVQPKIISKIVKNDAVGIPESTEKRIMSEETAAYMVNLMSKTVEAGTGRNAGTQITHVAGKTGTSRIYDQASKSYSNKDYSASFAGVFPAENPSVAMIVVYESPTTSIYGGATAATIFKQIAEYLSTEKYLDKDHNKLSQSVAVRD